MASVTHLANGVVVRTANDRLKDSFWNYVFGSITAVTAAHFALITFGAVDTIPDYTPGAGTEMAQVEVRQYELPPPPSAVQRPAIPVLSTNLSIADDITIGETTFHENPVAELPPPPSGRGIDLSEQPVFTPYEVRPELLNRAEFQRALLRRYPISYRNAGIGGVTLLWVFIDEAGKVKRTKVMESSGYPELDDIARTVMEEAASFSPAFNRDQRVPVWIQIPLTFQAVTS